MSLYTEDTFQTPIQCESRWRSTGIRPQLCASPVQGHAPPLVTLHQTKCPSPLPLSFQTPTESETGISCGGEVVLCVLLFMHWCRSELGKCSDIHSDRGVYRIWRMRKRGMWRNWLLIIITAVDFTQGALFEANTHLRSIPNHRHRTLLKQRVRDNPQKRIIPIDSPSPVSSKWSSGADPKVCFVWGTC